MDERLPLDAVQFAKESCRDVPEILKNLSYGLEAAAIPFSTAAGVPILQNGTIGKHSAKSLKESAKLLEYVQDSRCRRQSLQQSEQFERVADDGNNKELTTRSKNEFKEKSFWTSICVYFCWLVLMVFAFFREFLRKHGLEKNLAAVELDKQRDFVPLFDKFEVMYARNCYMRVRDVFERVICGVPGASVKLCDRYSTDYNWSFEYMDSSTEVINMGSYNYLGFAEEDGFCAKNALSVVGEQGLTTCCSIHQIGQTKSQFELERLVAEFLGVEDAICFSMGFATNSLNTPCLADEDTAIISDQYNHASLILGSRMSGASITIFKHDDLKNLETTIRNAIAYGNKKTGRPYKKVLIIVEGIYSMEGTVCNLPAIIALKKKYGAYIYLDEAHSIGALGPRGRGVVDYWGCDPHDVDILMGTFTKSFGAAGGYIAGSKRIINHIRANSPAVTYALPMSPPVVQQIISSMKVMMGLDGTNDGEMRRIRLRRNTHYFRKHLKKMGCNVFGHEDSPVVPIMLYYPTKCGFWGREMLKRGIGVVVVSFPATHMTDSRLRICLSAGHTKEMLDHTLNAIREVAIMTNITFSDIRQKYADLEIEW